jgi:hypothetical protein
VYVQSFFLVFLAASSTSFVFAGFSELSLNDQMRLLQNSWSEILTLSLVFRSLPRSGRLNFAADFSITEAEAAECGLNEFYSHVSYWILLEQRVVCKCIFKRFFL